MAWNLGASISHLRESAKSKSQHQCAKFVREALGAGGINTTGRPGSAYQYKEYLPKIGFNAIGKITGKSNQLSWTKRSARPGDIAVMDHGEHGHICMFDGIQWISDFRQNNMWVYGGDGTCYIFRYGGELDPTLDAFTEYGSTGLHYLVPLDQQKDHIYIKNFGLTKYNLMCELLESFGNMNLSNSNDIIYDNEISRDDSSISESLVSSGMYWTNYYSSGIDSEFDGAGLGILPRPLGFYSDKVLFEFISQAEGNIGVQWVRTYKGHDIVIEAACFGYDFPGGVHDPSYIKKLGLTIADTQSLGITNRGRKPIGGESHNGRVQWGWYTNPIPPNHSYWKKLIPYYRDAMIWAWNQPIIQAVKDPAERLARMHSINWWGYHYLKGFHGGSGWKHRFQMAQRACHGMKNYT